METEKYNRIDGQVSEEETNYIGTRLDVIKFDLLKEGFELTDVIEYIRIKLNLH